VNPYVTVAIPVRNAEAYIDETLASARCQSYEDIEILVVDNASTDDTVPIVERVLGDDDRIRFLRNETNIGMAANFNRCLELATGRYVKFLCSDDLIEPTCVERMVTLLEKYPRVSLVGCARRQFAVTARRTRTSSYAKAETIVSGPEAMNRCFFEGNLIGEPTAVMFRRAQAARGFSPYYSQALDLEMWFHLLEQGDFAFLQDVLCAIRLHDDQQTVRNARSGRIVEDKRRLFHACLSRPWLRPTLRRKLHWDLRMASSVAKAGDLPQGGERPLEEVFFREFFECAALPAMRLALRILGS
jgi:glycosyltransferase involved in cell wall biosynthesis